jgi:hypothetical protein
MDAAGWDAVLALAEAERVLPWLAARLRARGETLSPYVVLGLEKIERNAAIEAFYWSSQLKAVLRALNQANIFVVPLKGPMLAERLYGSAALRLSQDLDLLVPKADFARAGNVLANMGFAAGEEDDYHRQWIRQNATVEIHFDAENPLTFNFGVKGAIRDSQPANFQGEPCRQLAPPDELAFLCLHAARHRYDRLSLIVDIQLAFEKLQVAGCPRRPELREMRNLEALGLAMVRRLQPGFSAATVALPIAHPRLERLADELWNRILVKPGKTGDWKEVHEFYLEIEEPGWPRWKRRARDLQILATRVIELDYRFAAKFGLHRSWQVRMLRPVRLITAAIRPR